MFQSYLSPEKRERSTLSFPPLASEASRATMEATAMAAEEVLMEVEAVQAVYGDDCRVINGSPLRLTVHLRPRTADDSSQQFVEVVLGIALSPQYPETPPYIYIVDTKGLDENRQKHLILKVKDKAEELSSCLMLVALCEEAIEVLSNMNHPEGNCPLCLYPLVSGTMENGSCTPFMKLMSCYHCFHSECFIRLWNWIQQHRDSEITQQTITLNLEDERDTHAMVKQHKGNCPVCRKVFEEKDFEHVHDYVGVNSSGMNFVGMVMDDDEDLVLHSQAEVNRRQQFEILLKQQQEKNGIIEAQKYLSVLPGMFLPEPLVGPPIISEGTSSGPGEENAEQRTMETDSHSAHTAIHKAGGNKRKTEKRKTKTHNQRAQLSAHSNRKQWLRRELDPSEH